MNTKTLDSLKILFFDEEFKKHEQSGIFLGFTKKFHIPFFVNFSNLKNYNITVIGPTGYGKTFFAKSLAYRCALEGIEVDVLDWNGEYKAPYLNSVDLSRFDENKKLEEARKFLKKLKREISASPIKKFSRLVFVEEAWKVKELVAPLVREVRKKGVGIVAISQLNEDITQILENSALNCSFEERGVCSVNGVRIKVVGMLEGARIAFLGDKMEISKSKLKSILSRYLAMQQITLLFEKIEENGGEIKLEDLTKRLLESCKVEDVIRILREIGFNDLQISDALGAVTMKNISSEG